VIWLSHKQKQQRKNGGILVKVVSKRIAMLAASVGLCAGLSAFGQQLTNGQDVPVQFTGGYSTTWANSSGDYGAGIYTGNVNGTSTGIICDDFSHDISNGETWTAQATQASTLANGNVAGLQFPSIQVTGYAEIATLVSMMFSGATTYGSITGITQAELSSAIWDIGIGGTLSGLDTNATQLVAAVEAAFNGNTTKAEAYLATLTNLWILTPTNWTGYPNNGPQEMWVETPEGGAALMYLLLATLFCGWAFFLRDRERVSS
jgi:hypothetical protein